MGKVDANRRRWRLWLSPLGVGWEMLQKLRTVWKFLNKGRQDCENKLWTGMGRDETAVFAVMGQQRGIVEVDIVRTFLEVQPVERTGRGRREPCGQHKVWGTAHRKTNTAMRVQTLSVKERAWNGNHRSSRSIVLHHEERARALPALQPQDRVFP